MARHRRRAALCQLGVVGVGFPGVPFPPYQFDDGRNLGYVNWVLLVLAFQAFRFRRTNSTMDAILVAAGFGALAIVAWEVMEWAVDETGAGGGLGLTYGDTIGDLTLSTSGGITGAVLGRFRFGPAKS